MVNKADIFWFKENFAKDITPHLADTPFDLDMVVAIACQESGSMWSEMRKANPPLPLNTIVSLCVGDTLDEDKGRKAFPRTKDELVAWKDGDKMFEIARAALLAMSEHVSGYGFAKTNKRKFCHGFGVFQYDLQFFKEDPKYFLEKKYETFEGTRDHCISELLSAVSKIDLDGKKSITDSEFCKVAIVYNTGSYKPIKGLKQGHFDGEKFYGENIADYLRMSRTVALPGHVPVLTPPASGTSSLPAPTPVTATGAKYIVDTKISTLRIRSEPQVSTPPTKNVIGELPDGHPVQAVGETATNGFLHIQTSLNGALLDGYVSTKFIRKEADPAPIPVLEPITAPVAGAPQAVYMPIKSGTVIRRTAEAGAHSLNEAGAPSRTGTTPDELRAGIAAIIDWLGVDKEDHVRYQPTKKKTFCNIYAHDFCKLAGVYLPRVWWTDKALMKIAQGEDVAPLYADTIDEQRANDLFRWLRDFGMSFGWRQTGTLTKLQDEVNFGAIGLIIAQRKVDGLSGHVVMVVPETTEEKARRNAGGEVIAPLQSQAGATNFRYGTGKLDWWKDERFSNSAFWIHA